MLPSAMAVDEWMLEWMQQSQSPLSVLASAMGEAWAGVRKGSILGVEHAVGVVWLRPAV